MRKPQPTAEQRAKARIQILEGLVNRALNDSGLTRGQAEGLLHENPATLMRYSGFGKKTIMALEELLGESHVVVTRHPALIEFLLDAGLVPTGTPVISHATADDVRGKHVFGVLPLSLAVLAKSITEVGLNLPPELRGVELSLAQVHAHTTGIQKYFVTK